MTHSNKNCSKPNANWHKSEYAQQYYAQERSYLDAGLRQSVGPKVLQIGGLLDQSILDDLELPYLLTAVFEENADSNVVLDPAFLPFSPDSFSTVVLPHALETQGLHHQILREAHRVLQAEGHLVLTGFNPHSLMGVQRFLRPKAVIAGRYHSVAKVIDWLQLLGFEVVTSSMFQYAPLSKRQGFRTAFNFLETIGGRWLPMTGGGYMISAKKRDVAHTMVGRLRFKKRRTNLIPAAAGKMSLTDKVSLKKTLKSAKLIKTTSNDKEHL